MTARRFARREIAPKLEGESRDGDLSQLNDVLKLAEEVGLVASPHPDHPGYDFGVWGKECQEQGIESSLVILEEIAVECAGIASCIHASGLASSELEPNDKLSSKIAVSFCGNSWQPTWQSFESPPKGAVKARLVDGSLELNGAASFVMAPPDCEKFVVFAGHQGSWEQFLVPAESLGLSVNHEADRLGLAAVDMLHLNFEETPLTEEHKLGAISPLSYIRRNMLGLSAIAIGNALGALSAARSYAEERYQGGTLIEKHPAVQTLLGESGARVALCSAALADGGRQNGQEPFPVWRALALKLRITAECWRAVSDCLQVLGGYGYMEDYGLEKRLRDAMTLKLVGFDPRTLKILCSETATRGG